MSPQLKVAKDALVSSLYELSKAANDASAATVNYYNASLTTDEDTTKVFADLSESLKLLTRAAEGVSSTAHTIAGDSIGLSGLGDVHLSDITLPTSEEPPKKKQKAEKDPYAPKKPLTVFFAYSAHVRESLRAEREIRGEPKLSPVEVTKYISEEWNNMSDEEKAKWKEAYNEELKRYQDLKDKYIQDKVNGVAQTSVPTVAPVPLPAHLLTDGHKKKKSDSVTKEEKKKRKKEKKEKRKSMAGEAALNLSS